MIDASRLRLLEAMGVDVYALRAREEPQPAGQTQQSRDDSDGVQALRVAVVCAKGVRADARLARLFTHLPQIFGTPAETLVWLDAGADGELAAAAEAQAYLVFGATMARALGAQLSTRQQSTATIAVTAEPAQLPGGAADKRALWQALKPIARRLRGAVG